MQEDTLSYSEKIQAESAHDIDSIFQQRIDLLHQIIEEIINEIKKRKVLRNGALRDIEDELEKFSSLLLEVAPLGLVNISGKYVDSQNARRMHIEKSIARLNELKRNQKVESWKDIVALKRDLFKLLPEYSQLLQLKKVMD